MRGWVFVFAKVVRAWGDEVDVGDVSPLVCSRMRRQTDKTL